MSEQRLNPATELPGEVAATFRADAVLRAERTNEFWQFQQIQIHERIRRQQLPRPQPLRIALAGAVVIFLAVFLTAPTGQRPEAAPQASVVDADQQLLVAVEHAIASGTPEALEPLTLLVESSSNLHDMEGKSHKERQNED